MKNLSLPAILLSGLVLSILASIQIAVLSGPLYLNQAFSLSIAVTTALYIGALLKFSEVKIGRLVALTAYLSTAVLLIISGLSADWFVLFSLSVIWLYSTVYYRFGLFTALCHALLLTAGLFTASWVLSLTGNWFLCFWCFFLVQSLLFYAPLPAKAVLKKNDLTATEDSNAIFENAFNCADKAVQQLLKI